MKKNTSISLREAIGSRIRELRKKHQYSQTFVANGLSITQAAYSRIENSSNGIVVDHIIKLSGLYQVTTDYILKGNDRLVEMTTKNGFVPFMSLRAQAGFIEANEKVINYDQTDWFKIPGFNPSLDQKLFEVEGNSMAPTILPRDILICQEQPKAKNLLNGTLVLLVTNKEVVVKRFENLLKDSMRLSSDNPTDTEPTIEISLKDIKHIMIVCGKITSALVPHHQIVSEGKMKSLEESVNLLKKELFAINKKLHSREN
ncbi:XRE family transcriptional regulator [Salinimicrobium sp. CAU 1759]